MSTPAQPQRSDPLLGDPYDRWSLQPALRLGATVVLGTHRDLGYDVARVGLSIETIHLPPVDVGSLMDFAQRRIDNATSRSGQPTSLSLTAAMAAHIQHQAGSNWRVVGDELHKWAASEVNQPSPS